VGGDDLKLGHGSSSSGLSKRRRGLIYTYGVHGTNSEPVRKVAEADVTPLRDAIHAAVAHAETFALRRTTRDVHVSHQDV
jgi:hypothetical protein